MSASRKIESGRYFKRGDMFMDMDDGGYRNLYSVLDRGKDTGISIAASGHSRRPDSHQTSYAFRGVEYPTLREAVIAYEDSLSAVSPTKSEGVT